MEASHPQQASQAGLVKRFQLIVNNTRLNNKVVNSILTQYEQKKRMTPKQQAFLESILENFWQTEEVVEKALQCAPEHRFVNDVADKFYTYGSISPNQVNALRKFVRA